MKTVGKLIFPSKITILSINQCDLSNLHAFHNSIGDKFIILRVAVWNKQQKNLAYNRWEIIHTTWDFLLYWLSLFFSSLISLYLAVWCPISVVDRLRLVYVFEQGSPILPKNKDKACWEAAFFCIKKRNLSQLGFPLASEINLLIRNRS